MPDADVDALDVVVRDMKPEDDDDPEDDGVAVAIPLFDPVPDPDPEALALPDITDCVALLLALFEEVDVALDDADGDIVEVGAPDAVEVRLANELAEAVNVDDIDELFELLELADELAVPSDDDDVMPLGELL